jgi:outer membrane protein OmpA-like peptidoglycan-associated protein
MEYLMRKLHVVAALAACTLAGPAQAQAQSQNCLAGPFMVFFNADSDELTPQAAAILDNLAELHRACGQPPMAIAGHTDRKRLSEYNVQLSHRYTMAVRHYLMTRGVPTDLMTTEAYGESRPLVETPDEVAEPQNRRVEISFGPEGW